MEFQRGYGNRRVSRDMRQVYIIQIALRLEGGIEEKTGDYFCAVSLRIVTNGSCQLTIIYRYREKEYLKNKIFNGGPPLLKGFERIA